MNKITVKNGEFSLSLQSPNTKLSNKRYSRRHGEDRLDYLHRLLKSGVGIEIAARLAKFPVESVWYVREINQPMWTLYGK